MSLRTKLVIWLCLVVWTSLTAWLTALLIVTAWPDQPTDFVKLGWLPDAAPVVAVPIAVWRGFKVLHRKSVFDGNMMVGYFLGTPAWIFLALLGILSLTRFVFAPIVFFVGLIVGLIPLLLGTGLHCFGAVPLFLLRLDRRPFRGGLAEDLITGGSYDAENGE
jgi:hypothetical protein